MTEWKYILDIRDLWAASEGKGGDMPVADIGKAIAARMKTKFAAMLDENPDNDKYDPYLWEVVDHLESITGYDGVTLVEEFDEAWESVYDWADRNRVWIKTTV